MIIYDNNDKLALNCTCSMKCIQYLRINYTAFAHIQTVHKHVAFTYRRMPLQNPITDSAALAQDVDRPMQCRSSQVPDPDRHILIIPARGQATVTQHCKGGHMLQYRVT